MFIFIMHMITNHLILTHPHTETGKQVQTSINKSFICKKKEKKKKNKHKLLIIHKYLLLGDDKIILSNLVL